MSAGAPLKKAENVRKSTQDKILLAATKVFAEHGFKDATTRMILSLIHI